MSVIEIGRLLRAGTTGFVAGCRVSQMQAPTFGALVRVPVAPDYDVFGLIYDMRIDDDGLVRQLVTTADADPQAFEQVIADNRLNRNVPLEMSVLAIGYRSGAQISHLLPPQPPLSLDMIYLCEPDEVRQFTSAGRFGYFRHLMRAKELPLGELLAAHFRQASAAHLAAGNPGWADQAAQELIMLLRDDYPILMDALNALNELGGNEHG
jgi:hypothetical protein